MASWRIRSGMAMLGYLNAPSPFDPDGWFIPQDSWRSTAISSEFSAASQN